MACDLDVLTAIAAGYGQDWYSSGRSAVLWVPSIHARIENNFLINPAHPDAKLITHEVALPVWWDARLYGKTP
jgi:RES domain-containing protein